MEVAIFKPSNVHYVNMIVNLGYAIKLKSDLDMNTDNYGTYRSYDNYPSPERIMGYVKMDWRL